MRLNSLACREYHTHTHSHTPGSWLILSLASGSTNECRHNDFAVFNAISQYFARREIINWPRLNEPISLSRAPNI